MEWVRLLEEPSRRTGDAVETVQRICRMRFREPLGIKQLADMCGVTREHLTREFASRVGMPPATYLRSVRVEAARRMLADGSIPLGEVAMRCGFPSARALNLAMGRLPQKPDAASAR
jgi:transcriptional regulator GlxA family with amidase domain